ncbi:F-box-like domain protein [Rhizoctonia solani]|uniref:F-box-like domain protein n=1 Tax=Rhizoctonia solani TaxID=456999 RepID=A0A8H8NZ37_9AGAM|nr:F-box-like domain protein [Rhizoctonia solani]QRW21382.1 F-box-like domain protein [Rhizoctonia solani]
MPVVAGTGVITSGITPNTRGLAALPNDILLKILEALDVESAVTFHRICKLLYVFATSRPAWLAIARMVSQNGILPLPLDKTYPAPSSLSTTEMKRAIQRGIIAQRALDRSSPALHVHSYLGTGSYLRQSSAYSLLSDQTVVHSAFLPGGRFLLTVQLDSSFACWDLESPTRTRSVRLQTGSDTVEDDEIVEPHCVAYWKTGGAYVEFAHDLVEEGNAVIVALLVIHTVPDQLPLIRNLHVLRIELPTPKSRRHSRPPIPDECMYNAQLLASAPIPHPLFVCSSYVHASGHAGLIGAMSTGPEVIFVLFFNPRPPPRIAPTPPFSMLTFAEAAAAVTALGNSRVTLVQCSFRTKPTRFYALGSAEHIILYCESGGCVYSYTHDVPSLRALAYARSAIDPVLVIPAPPPHEDPFPAGEHGTPGAPHIQKMCVVLRKRGPAWLEYGDDWVEYKPNPGTHKISALSMTIDAETTNLDAFQGLVIGIHGVDTNRKSVPRDDSMDMDIEMSVPDSARPQHIPNPQAVASPSPPPNTLPPTESYSSSQPASTQPPRYRRECRVRYKRTVFPSRLQCTWHELAALGVHGRRVVWIEGNGPPQDEGRLDVEPHDENATLRLMLSALEGSGPKEVSIPPSVRAQLTHVSCVAFEDSTGAIALATLDGRVILLQFT